MRRGYGYAVLTGAGASLQEYRKACRGCGAPVIFAWTVNGKKQCVYAEPVKDGNLRLRLETNPVTGGVYVLAEVVTSKKAAPQLFEVEEESRYIDHHVNCPEARRF